MKFGGGIPYPKALLFLVLLAPPPQARGFSDALVAGGWVPERKSLIVNPGSGEAVPDGDGALEAAVIEIDNNLPSFELVLDFSDRWGGGDFVSSVRLEGVDGMLGKGLDDPSGAALEPGPVPGRFVWSPGLQESATVGYRVRVLITCKRPFSGAPQLAVSMPPAY
jgi:hypothetical protein